MARRKFWLTNRVVLGVIAFIVITALWEFKWKPQYHDFYEEGVRLYKNGNYQLAQKALDKAYEIAPNALDVIIMEGWNNLKQNQLEQARFYFTRAVRIDPTAEEAQMGISFVALETGHGDLDPALLTRILQGRKNDANVMILLAGAEERQGDYFSAAQIYTRLLNDKDYGEAARLALDNIFGLHGTTDNPISAFPALQRPAETQLSYRANNGALWQKTNGNWSKTYLQGVDLGAAPPGYRPTSLPNDATLYTAWLHDASQLSGNTLRLYTLLPPSFYRAFHHYVDDGGKVSLIQQIWTDEPDHQDLFEPGFEDATKAEIRQVIDAIHGRGQVLPKRNRGSGIYEFDISGHISGYILGRDLDPAVVSQTNLLNAGKHSYAGKYLSINNASATEMWLVEMSDYLLDYEASTYNWQHPIAMVSGPAPDPSSSVLLETKIKTTPAYLSGIFAAYPAYPFYPAYMQRNPRYANARDKMGLDPVFGFVRELRTRLPVPLLVSEYGASTSMEPRLTLSSGWNQGGYNEKSQGDALVRLSRALRDAGVAGGLAFELTDEWYREGWITEGFQNAGEKVALSLNDLDPAKRYGLIGYHTSKWQLFTGDPAAWEHETKVDSSATVSHVGDGYDGERTLRSLQIASDEGYLYLRLQVACLDCQGSTHTGKTHFPQASYAIALSTLPSVVGIKNLPFGNITLPNGANFLLLLRDPERSSFLIADSYNPFQYVPSDDGVHRQLAYKANFSPSLVSTGTFQPFPSPSNPGSLPYGHGDPTASDYDSRAQWYADIKHSAILVRIPWAKLLVTDPSSMQVLATYDPKSGVRSMGTGGLQVSVYALRPKAVSDLKDASVISALPADGATIKFTSTKWNSITLDPYRKKAFDMLAQDFARSYAAQEPARPARRASPAKKLGAHLHSN